MTTTARTHTQVLVQVASGSAFPSTDGGWDTLDLVDATGASEGAGQVAGEAEFEQLLGNLLEPDGAAGTGGILLPEPSMLHVYVRLLKADPSGAITVDGETYTAFWWGTIEEAELDDVGRKKTWRCVGITATLASISLGWGLERPGAWAPPATFTDPGVLPPFNALPNGDRSAASDVVNGATVYVFDRYAHDTSSGGDVATWWTALQALEYLLAVFARPGLPPTQNPNGTLTWSVSDPLGALAYRVEPKLDLAGMTLLDAINYLINPRRGLTWRVTMVGAVATIQVQSVNPAAIHVGAFTLPANNAPIDLDLSTSTWIQELLIVEDASAVMDVIIVQGAFPRTALTLCYGAGSGGGVNRLLTKGWTSAQEAQWASEFWSPSVQTEEVWRRFVPDPDWEGSQFDVALIGLRATMTPSSGGDASYGWGGLTGARTYTPGGAPGTPPAWALRFDARLPIPSGAVVENLSGSLGFFDPTKSEMAPLVFIGRNDSWQDFTGRLSVRVEHEPPALCIGHSPEDAQYIKDRLAGSGVDNLAVTIALRETHPLAVSYVADPSTWPADVPRVLLVSVPHAELWTVLNGTVGSVTPTTGLLSRSAADAVIRDDTPVLNQVLALARAWYLTPSVRAQWKEVGIVDTTDATAPTALLRNLTTINAGVVSVNAPITRRRWGFRELEQFTEYTSERVVPDLQPIR